VDQISLKVYVGAVVAVACICLGWWISGVVRVNPLKAKIKETELVAQAQNVIYRKLEREVADAQKAHVDVWKRERARADDYWLRLNRSRPVPQVPAVTGSPEPDSGNRVETAGGEGSRALEGRQDDLSTALIDALATGERLEATLGLCQRELRACAGLR